MKITDFEEDFSMMWNSIFFGYDIEVVIELNDQEGISDYEGTINKLVSWDESFFKILEPMLFAYYENTLIMCGESEPVIQHKSQIWSFLSIGVISVFSSDGEHFVQLSGGCDWEPEHGLEIDINESGQVVYVGQFISNGFYEDPKEPGAHNFIEANA